MFLVFVVWLPKHLHRAFTPVLECMYRQEPESQPFQQPVDPYLLAIPVSCSSFCSSVVFAYVVRVLGLL